MPGHIPNLDPDALGRLRRMVRAMHRDNGAGLPMRDLVRMAQDVRLNSGVTVDFQASRDLGEPMIVVRLPKTPVPASSLDSLSPRVRVVAALVAEWLSNKQIARRLFISLATVKDHIHHILTKTGLSSRAGVAAAVLGHSPSASLDHASRPRRCAP